MIQCRQCVMYTEQMSRAHLVDCRLWNCGARKKSGQERQRRQLVRDDARSQRSGQCHAQRWAAGTSCCSSDSVNEPIAG